MTKNARLDMQRQTKKANFSLAYNPQKFVEKNHEENFQIQTKAALDTLKGGENQKMAQQSRKSNFNIGQTSQFFTETS